jgi:hypothetical protein
MTSHSYLALLVIPAAPAPAPASLYQHFENISVGVPLHNNKREKRGGFTDNYVHTVGYHNKTLEHNEDLYKMGCVFWSNLTDFIIGWII